MAQKLSGRESGQNIIEKAVGRMMGGSTGEGDQKPDIVVGTEYGRTPYSEEALKMYEKRRGKRTTLDASEYHVVTHGYFREWVCMAQCNLYMQVLKNPMARRSMETYRHDVCEPNLTEMANILEAGSYKLPAHTML